MSATLKILMPTDEEEAQINAGILSDPDSFVLSEQELETLQPTVTVFPEIVEAYQRGDFKEKLPISVSLNSIDINFVKAKEQETGIPFQAIIGALVHNYAIGKIKLEI